jgi:tetratricopeptide (TPR) repeat protein
MYLRFLRGLVMVLENLAMKLLKVAELLYDKNPEKAIEAYNKAIERAEEILDGSDRIITLSNIAKSLYSKGFTEKAMEVYDKAIKYAENDIRYISDVALSYHVVPNLCDNGLISMALDVAEKISDSSYKIHALQCIARAQYNSGLCDEAVKTCEKALALVDNFCTVDEKFSTLSCLAVDFYKYGSVDKAAEVLEKLNHPLYLVTHPKYMSKTVDRLAQVLTNRILKECFGIERQKMDELYFLTSLNPVDVVDDNKSDEALLKIINEFLKSFPEREYKFRILVRVAEYISDYGLYDKALLILDKIPDKCDKSQALYKIAKNFYSNGDCEKLIEISEKIRKYRKKSEVLWMIIKLLCKHEKYDEALGMIEKIPIEECRIKAMMKIVEILIDKGLYDKAMEITEKIPNDC